MASVVSPTNSASESVDSLVTSAGTTGIMKGAVGARSVAGGDSNVAAAEVATQVDDAAFTPGTSTVVVIAGVADETSPDSVDEGDAGALRMTLARNLHTVSVADAASLSSVASLASSQTILAANVNRIGCLIANDDANGLYIKYGATASTTSYTALIPTATTWTMPLPIWRGIIDGIWSADGSGSARVTELT